MLQYINNVKSLRELITILIYSTAVPLGDLQRRLEHQQHYERIWVSLWKTEENEDISMDGISDIPQAPL
jgi:hypothetical protein